MTLHQARARLVLVYAAAFAAVACVTPWLSWTLAAQQRSATTIGAAGALLTVAAVAAAPVWGRFEDHRPGRGISAALALTGVGAAGVGAAITSGSVAAVLVAVSVFGLASGALESLATGTSFRWLGQQAPVGLLRRAGSVAWIGGLAAGAAVASMAPTAVFLVATLLCLAVVPVVPRPPRADRRHTVRALALGRVARLLAHTLPIPTGLFVVLLFTGAFVHGEGASPWGVALPLAAMAVLEIPALGMAHRLSRSWPASRLVATAFSLLASAFVLLAARPSLLVLVAVQPLLAAGFSCWFVGQSRALSLLAPSHLAFGQTLAAVATKGVAGTLAGVGGGFLAEQAGFAALFLAQGALGVAGLALWLLLDPLARAPATGLADDTLPHTHPQQGE